MISLAATCISRTPKFSSVGIGLVAARRLYRKISRRGLPSNIYELALMTQVCNILRYKAFPLPPTHAQKKGEIPKISLFQIVIDFKLPPTF